jgi:uncharacterized membrane protein YqiK
MEAHVFMDYGLFIVAGLLFLFLAGASTAIARGDQFITVERRWFGKQMADGRTIALRNEVGVQARTLGPGVHPLMPFVYKVKKHKFISIGTAQIGIVRAITGMPMPAGQYFARTVESNLFQDGEAFLRNGGEKGPQHR